MPEKKTRKKARDDIQSKSLAILDPTDPNLSSFGTNLSA